MTLDGLWEPGWASWNLRFKWNVILSLTMLHGLMVPAIRILVWHVVLSLILISLVVSLLLRRTDSRYRLYISPAIVTIILLTINWWHILHHRSIILSVLPHLSVLIPLRVILASKLLILFQLSTFSHLVVFGWRNHLIGMVCILLISVHEYGINW